MTRYWIAFLLLAFAAQGAEVPAEVEHSVRQLRAEIVAQPSLAQFHALQQAATILQYQFPSLALPLALDAENVLDPSANFLRAQTYRLLLGIDGAQAAAVARRMPKADVFDARLSLCVEHRDKACGRKVLSQASAAGSYQLSHLPSFLTQLAKNDATTARTAYASFLHHFPIRTCSFNDARTLVDATEAIAAYDHKLASRGATLMQRIARDTNFEIRSKTNLSADLMIGGQRVHTATTSQTIALQAQSFLKTGVFPPMVSGTLSSKRHLANSAPPAVPNHATEALLERLANQVQQFNRFTLADLSGRSYALQSFRGRPVLLDFWATWCGPCRREMPQLEALHQHGLTVLAITDEDKQTVQQFISAHPYSFPVLLDEAGKAVSEYNVQGRPTNILINRDGKIVGRWFELPDSDVITTAAGGLR